MNLFKSGLMQKIRVWPYLLSTEDSMAITMLKYHLMSAHFTLDAINWNIKYQFLLLVLQHKLHKL